MMPQARPARLCEMAQILSRVGDDVVLTGDLLGGIDDMMTRARAASPQGNMHSSGLRWCKK